MLSAVVLWGKSPIQQIGLFPHRTVAENIATVPRLLGWDQGADRRAGRRAARARRPARDEVRDRYPGPALGRPAPAGRRRPRARRRSAADAHGRAVRRDRPDQPRAAAERVPAPAGRDAQDDRVRHPRHRRGDQDGRPHRDPADGRHLAQYAHARRAADRTRPTTSSSEFVGADRGAQAARAAARARRRPVEAPLVPRRRPAEVGAIDDSDVPYALLVDDATGRSAGSPSGAGGDARRPAALAEPAIELDDVLRDALATCSSASAVRRRSSTRRAHRRRALDRR